MKKTTKTNSMLFDLSLFQMTLLFRGFRKYMDERMAKAFPGRCVVKSVDPQRLWSDTEVEVFAAYVNYPFSGNQEFIRVTLQRPRNENYATIVVCAYFRSKVCRWEEGFDHKKCLEEMKTYVEDVLKETIGAE